MQKNLIYVVDDEQLIARTTCLILERHGYDCRAFFDAETALAGVEERLPDLVLSDVVMTGEMTGIDLAEKLSKREPAVATILLSGQAQTLELLDRAEERGSRVTVEGKPIQPARLLKLISSRLAELSKDIANS